ncbi:hypothetical protein DPEC_G00344920 [Dallia pectoralis]|uniref:Uncharacterized protein n=1 Tax=Dallia pectoralis TaxID=75939 RepID=A0ACC2F3E5_DALPE|nr:hypothetical protein DPEC_G00344920 [Dallia pectoralis]
MSYPGQMMPVAGHAVPARAIPAISRPEASVCLPQDGGSAPPCPPPPTHPRLHAHAPAIPGLPLTPVSPQIVCAASLVRCRWKPQARHINLYNALEERAFHTANCQGLGGARSVAPFSCSPNWRRRTRPGERARFPPGEAPLESNEELRRRRRRRSKKIRPPRKRRTSPGKKATRGSDVVLTMTAAAPARKPGL